MKLDAVGVVDQPVQDAVGKGGIADLIVPERDRDLAGEDGGACGVTVVTDFQEIAAFGIGQRRAMAQSSTMSTSMRARRSSS